MKINYKNIIGSGKPLKMKETIVDVLKVAGNAALVKLATIIVEDQKETVQS